MLSIYEIKLKCDTMKSAIKKMVLSVGGVLMTASNALAAEFESTGSFLSDTANKLDSMLLPFGEYLASNVPLIFKIVIGSAILLFAVLAVIYKKRGRSGEAAEHRASAWDVFTTGIIAIFLYSFFTGVCKLFGV